MRRKRQSSSRKRNNRKSRRQTKSCWALPSVSCMTPGRWKSCFPEKCRRNSHSILQCHQMLEQFRQTGNLLLQTPDRTTPLHLCIALGLNRLAVRMVETGAPVNAQSIFMHDGTKEPGDTPLTWACLSGLYMNSHRGRKAAAGARPAQTRRRSGSAGALGRHPVHVFCRPQ